MAVTLLSNGQSGSLSERRGKKAGGVRRRDETRQQFRGRMDGANNSSLDPNADINAIFQGIRSNRGMIRRNLDGSMADPNAPQGLDAFYAKNPHLRGAAERQAQYDQQAREALPGRLQSAVNERRAQQEMQNYNPNLVTGADGYRTIFDSKGGVIGTTRPMQTKALWSQDNAINKGTASGAEQRDFANTLQETGLASASGVPYKQKLKGLDMVFNGKSSPPGGGSADGVGSAQTSGAPGGDLFGQVPGFESRGMPLRGIQFPPNAGPRYQPMMPNEGPQPPMGPQLPYSSPEQLVALKRLKGFAGDQSPVSAALESTWNNIFPGVKDYEYLRNLFPNLVHPQSGSSQLWGQLSNMYNSPAYQSQFRDLNQSQFYK